MKVQEVLKDRGNGRTKLRGVHTVDVNAIPGDGSRRGPIQPGQKFRERRLTGTVLTDQRHDLARSNAELA
jgi:hypothetical protein